MDAVLSFLADFPVGTALSAIHEVLRGLKYRFDESDFERLVGSKYPSSSSTAGELAIRLRQAIETETGHQIDDLSDDEEERLTAKLAALGQELMRKSFGSDPTNATAVLAAFRKAEPDLKA